MTVNVDPTGFREEYEAFAATGGSDPSWYRRYSAVTHYLADVRQRVRSRPDGSPLRSEDIPALPEWGIAVGDVGGFLEMVWHSPDNGVSGLGRGRVRDQYWESMKLFSRDGLDLAGLTAAMIRDPNVEVEGGRATEWFEAWQQGSGLPPWIPRSVIFRFIAGLEPESYTSIVARDALWRFARQVDLSPAEARGSWYRMNGLVLDRLQLPSHDPIMRNCYVWDLAARLARETARAHETASRLVSYWAIAADPGRYDVVRAIAESDLDEWMTGGSALTPGDRVAFWKYKGSGKHRGVVGLGVVTSEPYEAPPSESPYWLKQPEDDTPVPRVDVRYLRLANGPVWLEDEASLGELSVARAQGGTVFEITPEQWAHLMELVGGWPEDDGNRRIAQRWAIYVPRSAAENLRIGRREGVWGVPKRGRLDGLQEGDEVLLVHDLADDGTPRPASFPRVALGDFHGRAVEVVTTVATSDPFDDDAPVWPDADYPQRFRFREEEAAAGVLMNAETHPADVLDAIRRSALEGGRPMPLDGEATPPPNDYVEPSFDEIVAAVTRKLRIDRAVLRRYHLSLKTRGFVILSGLSGSGKTWLTSAYAEAVGAQFELAPVAPNWTTNEDLLGYLNPLDGKYVDTPFSRFLRAAAREAERADRAGVNPRPFHLVLDEMNLARVEYYFATFLSAMERRARSEPATIELGQEHVAVPPNLMFIGTVNIDETTHLFADKVYDRAQLIELGIERSQVRHHLGDAPYGPAVLEVWDAVEEIAPFAYRTLDEIAAYVREAGLLGVAWETALDEQLVQKVLPKLKGANLRIGEVLDRFILVAAPFPLSKTKAIQMRDRFARDGFTSFF